MVCGSLMAEVTYRSYSSSGIFTEFRERGVDLNTAWRVRQGSQRRNSVHADERRHGADEHGRERTWRGDSGAPNEPDKLVLLTISGRPRAASRGWQARITSSLHDTHKGAVASLRPRKSVWCPRKSAWMLLRHCPRERHLQTQLDRRALKFREGFFGAPRPVGRDYNSDTTPYAIPAIASRASQPREWLITSSLS